MKKKALISRIPFMLFIFIGLVLIIIPISIFIKHFGDAFYSSEIDDWGSFGAYFGGILGVVISFLSLIILGYITYIVGKNSTKENKNLFLLKKRIEAFDELMQYIQRFNLMSTYDVIVHNNMSVASKFPNDGVCDQIYLDNRKNHQEMYLFFAEIHFYLYLFNARYSHVFTYNFKSQEYSKLIEKTALIKNYYSNIFKEKQTTSDESFDLGIELTSASNYLLAFVNALKEEIE